MKRFLFLLFGIVFLTGCGNVEGMPQAIEQEEMLSAGEVVRLRVGNVSGNGVVWKKTEKDFIVVTAGHIFEMGNGEAEVIFADGLTVAVKDYEIMKPDLAFVSVDIQQLSTEQLEQYYAVTEEVQGAELQNTKVQYTESLQSEDRVVLKTFGTGEELQMLEGKVIYPWIYFEEFEAHMILAELDAKQGMSGSGLFDCEGQFLGVLCGQSEDGEAAVISFSVIEAAYAMISENF
uniref:S1 family peptidase n=1 Tax=Acetatifactor sp. TaxID=1872090 RepID=UPI0040567BF3